MRAVRESNISFINEDVITNAPLKISALLQNFIYFCHPQMVVVAQLVRASDCDSEGRGFEPHHPPKKAANQRLFIY